MLLEQHKRHKQGKFRQVYSKLKGKGKEKEKARGCLPSGSDVKQWMTEEVGQWLDSLGLGEYREAFISHDIQGSELLTLERRDLKELGVTKVGHLKRIQQSIRDLANREIASEKSTS